jgi:tetratricopeptide (TPR) repeat protein
MSTMSLTDCRGLNITAPNATVIERFDGLLDDIYYYRLGVGDRMDALLEEHPDFTLANVLKGYSLMSEGSFRLQPTARGFLERADALPANPREALHREALRGWIDGDLERRAAALEQILLAWPLDLLAYRQHTGTLFWTGAKAHQAEVSMGVASHWSKDVPGYAHFLSSHGFSLEEVGLYEVAERCSRAALAINPQDLWALHGVSHVLEMQGRSAEGVELLTEARRFLDDYNLFRGHLWWHLSLFLFSQGRFDEALVLFDTEIYPKSSTFYLDVQNGVSLLARLEFQGVDVGLERWQRLGEAATKSAADCTLWFTAMHYVMAQARNGDRARLQSTYAFLAESGKTSSQALLALELSKAAVDFCEGKPQESLAQMLALRQRHNQLGASHAQQDLYDQIMVTAAMQLGDLPRVRQLLKARLATRVWDSTSWQALEQRSRKIDEHADEHDRSAMVRSALRWSL